MLFAFDPIYLLLIAPALLAWFAQAKVREVYHSAASRNQKHCPRITRISLIFFYSRDSRYARIKLSSRSTQLSRGNSKSTRTCQTDCVWAASRSPSIC